MGKNYGDTAQVTDQKIISGLKAFLSAGKDWELASTNEPGVFYRVMKGTKASDGKATLAVNINPVDNAGNMLQRNGLNVRSVEDLDEFIRLLTLESTREKVASLSEINPALSSSAARTTIDI